MNEYPKNKFVLISKFNIFFIELEILKIKSAIIDYTGLAIAFSFIVLLIANSFSPFLPLQLVVIDNADPNSMNPTYQQGDIFILMQDSPDKIVVGDVIVYKPINSDTLIIHRVIYKEKIDGEYQFIVKGDNSVSNSLPDNKGETSSFFIKESQILGKTIFRAPFLGHFPLVFQSNFLIQLLLGGSLIAYIGFSFLAEERKSEKKYYEISKVSIRKYFKGKKKFVKSKKGLLFATGIGFIFILSIPQIFFPGLFNPNSTSTGIINVENPSNPVLINCPTSNNLCAVFYQVEVTVYDQGYLGNRINTLEFEVYNVTGDILSHTVWNSLGSIIGRATIGASIAIALNADSPLTDQELTFTVIMNLDSGAEVTESIKFQFTRVQE